MKEFNIVFLIWVAVVLFAIGLIILIILKFIKKDTILVTIEKSLKEGSYKKALNLALKIAKDSPKDFLIKYYIAQAYEGLKDYRQAAIYYERASIAASLSAQEEIKNQIFLKVAESFKKIRKYNESMGYYVLVLEKEPKNLKALFGISELLFEQENYRKAKEYLETYVKLKPDNLKARFMLGKSSAKTNDYSAAMDHLEFILQNIKINDEVLINNTSLLLADVYIATKNYSKAINILKKLLDKGVEPDVVTVKIADAYLRNNQTREAIVFAQQNLSKVSKDSQCELHYLIGNAYMKEDEIMKAAQSWQAAYKINPSYRDLRIIVSRYSYLIEHPELEPLFSKNESAFENFVLNLLNYPYIKQIIKKDSFWAIESGDICYVIYRKPFPASVAEVSEMEKLIKMNFKANTKCILFSLYGITNENNTSGDTYNAERMDLVSDMDFINRLKKEKNPE
ncbi:MAG: tetratricopeptide repeat protein [Brevinematia bacterium]